jgi:hypothetical protein
MLIGFGMRLFCFLFGHDPMWPVCGRYLCRRCRIYQRTEW